MCLYNYSLNLNDFEMVNSSFRLYFFCISSCFVPFNQTFNQIQDSQMSLEIYYILFETFQKVWWEIIFTKKCLYGLYDNENFFYVFNVKDSFTKRR